MHVLYEKSRQRQLVARLFSLLQTCVISSVVSFLSFGPPSCSFFGIQAMRSVARLFPLSLVFVSLLAFRSALSSRAHSRSSILSQSLSPSSVTFGGLCILSVGRCLSF